jgi:hypothetical protein
MTEPTPDPGADQPDPDVTFDGDRSWAADPAAGVDPDEDRSVDAVIRRSADSAEPFDEQHHG